MKYKIIERRKFIPPLPDPLFRLMLQYYALSAAIAIIIINLAVVLKNVKILLLVFMCVYISYRGTIIKRNWQNGNIKSSQLLFLTNGNIPFNRKIELIFLDADEKRCSYYVYGNDRADRFTPGNHYNIYSLSERPYHIIAEEKCENNT